MGAQARQAGAAALGQTQDVAQDARARPSLLASEAGWRIGDASVAQKDNLVDRIEHAAQAAHRSGEALEGQEDFVARLSQRERSNW